MQATVSTPPLFSVPRTAVRRISQDDIRWALAQGWSDFRQKRGDLIFLALLYPLMGLLAAVLAFNDAALPLFFPLVAGLSILGPAVASGFYELARRREDGLDSSWKHFFDPLKSPNRRSLLLLTAGLGILFLLWLAFAWGIYAATLGPAYPVGIRAFITKLFMTSEGWTMILLGNLTGLLFAIVTLVCTLVSLPMVIDRPVDAGTALETSIRAVRVNPWATTTWGLRVAGLLVLGCIPAFIGLAVVLPVLGYATWHLYTRMVERPAR
jgi:uncharacterized membrane protein